MGPTELNTTGEKYFPNWKINITYLCPAIFTTRTLTYLDVSLDKVLLLILAFRGSTVAAFNLVVPNILKAYFK